MIYCSIIIFIVSAVVHLYASLKRDKVLRNITKPFIVLSLIGVYCFSVDKIQATVVLALFFSWLGDVLLMPHGTKWFTAGGISFMISHFFFVISYIPYIDFAKLSPIVIILIAAVFFVMTSFIFTKLKEHLPKALFYPMYLYLLINGAMNCFAIYRLLSNPNVASIITVIGACLFYISDSALFFVRFNKNSRMKTHFVVMLTYTLAELLIVLGFIF